MPRPKKDNTEKSLSIPRELAVRVDLLLYSAVEERVPFGAWSQYVENLIRADLEARREKSV